VVVGRRRRRSPQRWRRRRRRRRRVERRPGPQIHPTLGWRGAGGGVFGPSCRIVPTRSPAHAL